MMVFSLFHGRRTRERETRANQRSAKVRAKVSQANKINPPPAVKSQGAAIKNPPPAGKAVGGHEKTPRQLERQWVAKKKKPDSLARTAQGQGQRGTREACVARVKSNFGRAREASTTQTRAKDKT